MAVILGTMVPEKRAALFARAADYGQSRIIVGVHYLTDIDAGRSAGTAIAALLLATPAFPGRPEGCHPPNCGRRSGWRRGEPGCASSPRFAEEDTSLFSSGPEILRQDLGIVRAERGRGGAARPAPRRRSPPESAAWGDGAPVGRAGRHVEHHPAPQDLRIREDFGQGIDRAGRHRGAFERGEQISLRARPRRRLEQRHQRVAVGDAGRIGGVGRRVAPGRAQNGAEPAKLPVICRRR